MPCRALGGFFAVHNIITEKSIGTQLRLPFVLQQAQGSAHRYSVKKHASIPVNSITGGLGSFYALPLYKTADTFVSAVSL